MKTCMGLFAEKLGRPLPDEWLDQLQAQTMAEFERSLEPIAGVRALIESVHRAGIPYCVASSGEPDKIRFSLGLTDLLSFFEGRIFSATMVERGKPSPDLFLHAARQMGAEPLECVVIEDSVPGVQAAISASMRTIGYVGDPHTDRNALGLLGAELVEHMDAIHPLLRL